MSANVFEVAFRLLEREVEIYDPGSPILATARSLAAPLSADVGKARGAVHANADTVPDAAASSGSADEISAQVPA